MPTRTVPATAVPATVIIPSQKTPSRRTVCSCCLSPLPMLLLSAIFAVAKTVAIVLSVQLIEPSGTPDRGSGGAVRQGIGMLGLVTSLLLGTAALTVEVEDVGSGNRRGQAAQTESLWHTGCSCLAPRGSVFSWLARESGVRPAPVHILQLIVVFWVIMCLQLFASAIIWMNPGFDPQGRAQTAVDLAIYGFAPNELMVPGALILLYNADFVQLRLDAAEGLPPRSSFLERVWQFITCASSPPLCGRTWTWAVLMHWWLPVSTIFISRILRFVGGALLAEGSEQEHTVGRVRAWLGFFSSAMTGILLFGLRSSIMTKLFNGTSLAIFGAGALAMQAAGASMPSVESGTTINFVGSLTLGGIVPAAVWVLVLRTESQRVGLLSKFLRYLSHEVRVPANVGLLALEDVKATLHSMVADRGYSLVDEAPAASDSKSPPPTPFSGPDGDGAELFDSELTTEELMRHAVSGTGDAQAALQQMKALLDRTLDLARFDAGVQQVDMQPLNLASTLASIHRAVMPAYRAAGVTLHWAVEGGLEDVEGGVHVLGDVLRIRQAIMNVLHNGSKYSARGDSVYFSASVAWSDSKRVSPLQAAPSSPTQAHMPKSAAEDAQPSMEHVGPMWSGIGSSVSSTATGGSANSRCHLLVRVRDTGRGMTDAEQASIFTPFARLHTAQEGTGLGLNIAKKAMVAHGGDVQVWSAGIGEGCTFTITAVLASVPEGMELPVSELSPVLEDEKEVVPRPVTAHILVVDDDTPTRRITGKLLYRSLPNSKVAFAVDGGEAVDMVKAGLAGEGPLPTHITLDDQMPVMTGRQAARAMRELGFTGRIVGVTGNAGLADQESFIAAGVDEVVVKPTTAAKLVAALLLHRQGQGKRMRPHASYAGRADAKARVLRA